MYKMKQILALGALLMTALFLTALFFAAKASAQGAAKASAQGLAGASVPGPTGGLSGAKHAIAASNAIYFSSFAKNDSAIFIDRYADDCRIMAPGAPALAGHEGAAVFFRMAYDKIGLRDGQFITTAVYGDGAEYVTEEGIWKSYDVHHVLFDHGKFLVLWKKTARGWKMFRDSFSSDLNQ
jgi:ketosteroid isomerase-like protein